MFLFENEGENSVPPCILMALSMAFLRPAPPPVQQNSSHSPVWMYVCFFMSDFWWKRLPQNWQGYGRVSEWMSRCVDRVEDRLNDFPHCLHCNSRNKSITRFVHEAEVTLKAFHAKFSSPQDARIRANKENCYKGWKYLRQKLTSNHATSSVVQSMIWGPHGA
jgi:hypothetical protein